MAKILILDFEARCEVATRQMIRISRPFIVLSRSLGVGQGFTIIHNLSLPITKAFTSRFLLIHSNRGRHRYLYNPSSSPTSLRPLPPHKLGQVVVSYHLINVTSRCSYPCMTRRVDRGNASCPSRALHGISWSERHLPLLPFCLSLYIYTGHSTLSTAPIILEQASPLN